MTVLSKEPDFFIPVKAIVDTGSPLTLIGSLDIKRMRLSTLQLNNLAVNDGSGSGH